MIKLEFPSVLSCYYILLLVLEAISLVILQLVE